MATASPAPTTTQLRPSRHRHGPPEALGDLLPPAHLAGPGPPVCPWDEGGLSLQHERRQEDISSATPAALPAAFLAPLHLITPLNINVPLPRVLLDRQPPSCLETARCSDGSPLTEGWEPARPRNLAERLRASPGGGSCGTAPSHPERLLHPGTRRTRGPEAVFQSTPGYRGRGRCWSCTRVKSFWPCWIFDQIWKPNSLGERVLLHTQVSGQP